MRLRTPRRLSHVKGMATMTGQAETLCRSSGEARLRATAGPLRTGIASAEGVGTLGTTARPPWRWRCPHFVPRGPIHGRAKASLRGPEGVSNGRL